MRITAFGRRIGNLMAECRVATKTFTGNVEADPPKIAVSSPAAAYFICAAKRSRQEKAAPLNRHRRWCPCVTQRIWRLRNSPKPRIRVLRAQAVVLHAQALAVLIE